MVLEAWMYANPEEIGDRIRKKSEADQKREKQQQEQHRKHKSRRIRALVKQAMKGRR
jgi:hypothetical protein